MEPNQNQVQVGLAGTVQQEKIKQKDDEENT
jgi:hypothetical protein